MERLFTVSMYNAMVMVICPKCLAVDVRSVDV